MDNGGGERGKKMKKRENFLVSQGPVPTQSITSTAQWLTGVQVVVVAVAYKY